MELRHLRYFLAVAEELHFGRAAQRLQIAQPPLSQQIQRLERELGVQLFDRNRRRVQLTRGGRALLVEAQKTVAQADRVRDVAESVRTGETGHVRLAFVGSALYGELPTLLRSFRARAPQIELTVREMETGAQVRALVEDRIDVGAMRPPVPDAGLRMRDIGVDDLVVALPADHPLPVRRPVPLAALAAEPFVFFPPELGTGFWDVVVRSCGAAGFTPNVVYQAEHVHTMIGLVAAGVGVSLVPEPVRRLSLPGVRYQRLARPVPALRLALAWDPSRSYPALQRFLAVLTGSPATGPEPASGQRGAPSRPRYSSTT